MKSLSILLVAIALFATCAWTQTSGGTVNGTVRDQSGAVIPNVPVVLANTDTNVTSTTRTNETGVYFFPGLIPGPYKLTVESPGMQKYEGAFTVQTAQSVVIDPVMRPGTNTTSVA